MSTASRNDPWQGGGSYEAFMGRWSRQLAPLYLDWLGARDGLDWLDVGCGTGALSAAILAQCHPKSLTAIDSSESFVATAREMLPDPRVAFYAGDALELGLEPGSRDAVVSGLVLNFLPDRARALAEMKKVARPGGIVGFYVWDYPNGGIQFTQAFWSAAKALDPGLDVAETQRFSFCTPEGLTALASAAGLTRVACAPIEMPMIFRSFEDYWRPFTLGVGPAPSYCVSLDAASQERLRDRLREDLPRGENGIIPLIARAWAIKAVAS